MNKIKLGEIIDTIQGSQYPLNEQIMEEKEGYYRFLRISDYTKEDEPIRYVKYSGKELICEEDEVVVVRYGNVGFIGYGKKGILANNLFALRKKNKDVLNKYIYYFLNSPNINSCIINKANSSTMAALTHKMIKELEIPIIDIQEQRKIVDKLDKIQEIIDIRKKQIEDLEELVKSQFVEMFGDPIENPKNYKIVKLSDIADYWNGLTYKPTDVNKKGTIVLRSSNIQNFQLDYQDIVRVNCNIKEKQYVEDNDILMCSRNGSARLVGKVAVIKDIKEKMTFGAFMMIIRSEYYPYLFSYFQTDAFRKQIKSGATTTINQITGNMLNKIKLPLPDKDDINQFANIVKQIDKQKIEKQKSLEEMEKLQDSLMNEYFGGEI